MSVRVFDEDGVDENGVFRAKQNGKDVYITMHEGRQLVSPTNLKVQKAVQERFEKFWAKRAGLKQQAAEKIKQFDETYGVSAENSRRHLEFFGGPALSVLEVKYEDGPAVTFTCETAGDFHAEGVFFRAVLGYLGADQQGPVELLHANGNPAGAWETGDDALEYHLDADLSLRFKSDLEGETRVATVRKVKDGQGNGVLDALLNRLNALILDNAVLDNPTTLRDLVAARDLLFALLGKEVV